MSAPPVSPSVSSPSGRVKRHSGYFEQPIKAPNLQSFSDSLPEPHIVAVLQQLYDRGIGRRPSDPQLFQFLDEAGFAVARRRLREMLVRRYDAACDALAVAQIRQTSLAFLLRRLVAVFLVELQKTVEHDDRTGHVQPDLAARIGDVDADLVEQRGRHLA